MVVYGLKYNILVPLVSCLPACLPPACWQAGQAGRQGRHGGRAGRVGMEA